MDHGKLDRTWLCSVLFMDIVSYSTMSVQAQMELKQRFNQYLGSAIKDVPENDRVILDTGDGAAVCFLGAPEAAMFTALQLRNEFSQDFTNHEPGLRVRLGINLGPVKLVRDLNGNLNALGDGINSSQRVMSFSGENQILVSRSFYEVVSCISDGYDLLFRFEGVKKDKHVKEHLVYQLAHPPSATDAPAEAVPVGTKVIESSLVNEGTGEQLRVLLSPLVGPISGRLVKQASLECADLPSLIAELAGHISDANEAALFVGRASKLLSTEQQSSTAPEPAIAPAPSAPPPSQAAAAFVPDAALVEKARQQLAHYIGPLARVIVERAAKKAKTRNDFVESLGQEVPAQDKQKFLASLR